MFPNQPEHSISQKHQQGLKPNIIKLLHHGLLCPIHSPCNIYILPVKKPNGSYCLVQDLRLINVAIVPIHPVVPNPTTHFTVLDLKDAFFTIPLHPDAQDLFAFTWTDPDNHCSPKTDFFGQSSQKAFMIASFLWPSSSIRPHLSWPYSKYCPPICGQSPPLWSFTYILSTTHYIQLFNFLADWGYRVSPTKVHFSLPRVTYLGVLLTPTKRYITTNR